MTSTFPLYDLADFGGSYDTMFDYPKVDRYPRTIVDAIIDNADARNRPRLLDLGIYLHESAYTLNPFLEVHTAGEDSYGIGNVNARVPGRDPTGQAYLGLPGLREHMRLYNDQWDGAFHASGRGWPYFVRNLYSAICYIAPDAQGSDEWSDEQARQAIGRALLLEAVARAGDGKYRALYLDELRAQHQQIDQRAVEDGIRNTMLLDKLRAEGETP